MHILQLSKFCFQETLSAENKKSALQERPSILELFAHSFFPSAFLVGPQFHMKRYQKFVAGRLIPSVSIFLTSHGCLSLLKNSGA